MTDEELENIECALEVVRKYKFSVAISALEFVRVYEQARRANTESKQILSGLFAAQRNLELKIEETNKASQRRRTEVQKLIDLGHSLTWIGRQLGITRQAVNQLLKSKEESEE